MTRQEKNQLIDELSEVLREKNVVYLTDASGLDAETTTQLRRESFKKDVTVRVVKNSLLRKAMERVEDKNFEELYSALIGQTALMIGDVGNVPAKLIKEFAKKHEKPVLKAAYVEEACYVGANHLDALTSIKSKEELVGDIIMLLQSPAKNVLGALQSGGNTISGLVKALESRGA
ncbi:MAG: 50S ribosomal protein L10 [Bacteroidetes bacterium]|jgi:large subunit ribosomal protein L10|nr:50S ribosomal protein L10 [Bacteroidota bacterium]MDA1337073.1 50S ribosomal protein L10 [Bacteroidota bacterium]